MREIKQKSMKLKNEKCGAKYFTFTFHILNK